jgi:hypothetical protein
LNGSPVASDINVIRTRIDEEIQRLGVVPIPLTTEDESGIQPEATADIPSETTAEPDEAIIETTPELDDSVDVTEEAPTENGDS